MKSIPGYEGFYSITEDGRVWRDARIPKGHYKIKGGYWMKSFIGTRGYVIAALSKNCIRKHCLVHRLVALTYLDNPSNRPEVNHKDGDKTNNHISNLEWVTKSENELHSWASGLHVSTEKHKAAARENIKIASAVKQQILSKE